MLLYLNALFVGLLVISNIISVKLFDLGGGLAILPAAAIVYVFTYPLTDVIGEVYGKEAARQTVNAGFITQIFASLFILIAINLPPAEFFNYQEEFKTILSGSFRIIIASLIAYVISQNLDVVVFHKLKQKHGTSKLWLRNNSSTMASQLVDTTLFITIAFYGVLPTSALLGLIATQYIFKMVVAIIDTPLVYLLVRLARKSDTATNKLAA
ncbi:MAG: queuosine precursor transporter [Anaerobacillus sp.]|uniref:queuosine precursor transporter n=1 Tax=Anaerobacillus sp. TaxID=1872506 RepID=UPI00391B0F56